MIQFLLAVLTVLSIFTLVCNIVLIGDFKYYRKIYKQLDSWKFYRNGDQLYTHAYNEDDNGFVYFMNNRSFCLIRDHYIHNFFPTYLSPYTLYWLIKYRRYFKNINLNRIQKY